jgi:hypothetical protein
VLGKCDSEGVELKTIKFSIRTKITNRMAVGGIACALLLQVDSHVH